ncbi:division/cell wall cluster transcriptional repressor MraZ [Oceaniovalibus sp. ACAM 378]|uniref:division/cell wall cluster transcriptional repressor MraZ n=1 Tax=Oceaniovalibus sp. ACAM 378 TaxID=2599923 RepID=UPI0011D4D2DF|nr:cell division/cell wall cluster transcriptional repressor MraZ [Oceaniovalibus sp. ACAM 378]TYB87979.1 cell division/cell wall cluster transcriptional repressor MraZ [Oceaniovalibus sp. ACAM 378]
MFGVFIGEHENKIDTKYRLSIPADFRHDVEEADPTWSSGRNASMFIVYGDERRRHLEVLTMKDMMSIHQMIAEMPRGSAKRADLQNFYGAKAVKATLDETGRIVVGPKPREKLGLKPGDLLYIIGKGQNFEIWQPEVYDAQHEAALLKDDDYDPNLDPSAWLPAVRP